MTGLTGIFDLPILMEVALWALAVASTVTVVQRIWVVRRQALAEAGAAGLDLTGRRPDAADRPRRAVGLEAWLTCLPRPPPTAPRHRHRRA